MIDAGVSDVLIALLVWNVGIPVLMVILFLVIAFIYYIFTGSKSNGGDNGHK